MLREADGVAGHILVNLGLVLEEMRRELQQLPPPENRDWMLQPSPGFGVPLATDPSPRSLEAIVSEEPLPKRVVYAPSDRKPDTTFAREDVAAGHRRKTSPVIEQHDGSQDGEAEARPWEHQGHVRRDCEPYSGYTVHALAWCGVICAAVGLIMMPVACLGLIFSGYASEYAQRDINRMRRGLLDPSGMEAAQSALRLARTAAIANAVSVLLCVSAIIALVVLVSRI
jgi:hypothetical protein